LNKVIERIRATADYQFGRGVGIALFPDATSVEFSRNTGRIRYVYLKSERLATLRPTDGLFSLSIAGAKRIIENADCTRCVIVVQNAVSGFIAKGGDVFAVHVVEANDEIRARDEVIVVDEDDRFLAVGRAVLSGEEMKRFKKGVAVKVRRGSMEER
jgi:uncharacterized protein with predicted RNA binding PUA domain